MSEHDETPTDTGSSTLGPKPDAQIEPGEPNPGGVDAIEDGDGVDTEAAAPDPLVRDLDPDDNPAVDDVLPDEVKQGEDTSTKATSSDSDEDAAEGDVDADEDAPA